MKGGKHTKREHYESAGIPRDQWGLPDLPEAMYYLWDWFIKLHNQRQSGMGENPISWTEIDSFCRLMRVRLDPWEVEVILQLDMTARLSGRD